MASAFSPAERETIDELLVQNARQSIVSIGIRRTTLEQLTQQAGISKSAFYKFYESKEHLFFRVMEEWHTQVYGAAEDALRTSTHLPLKERVANALLAAFSLMDKDGMMAAVSQELPYLLRRLPSELLDQKYHSDEAHIIGLVEMCDVEFIIPKETVYAMLMIVATSMLNRQHIGPLYQPALETIVQCICDQMIKETK